MKLHPPISVSVIIPTLNEAESITQCLTSIPTSNDIEVIIADAGSTDATVKLAAHHPNVKIINSKPGRARQMNCGAQTARGDVLLFLHADTTLSQGSIDAIQNAISDEYSMGCFQRKFDSNNLLLHYTSCLADWRARHFFLAFGDQAIFLKTTLFQQLGGFQEIKEFEDMDLTRRARHHGKWCVLKQPIITSARRFNPHPYWRILTDAVKTTLWLIKQK